MVFEVYSRRNLFGKKRWFWHLKAHNGEVVAQGETNGYHNREDCFYGIKLVQDTTMHTRTRVLD